MDKKKENKLGSREDVFIKNRFGIIEPIYDQCNKTCLCKILNEKCRSDELFFRASYMYGAYRANMEKDKKNKKDS